MARRGGRTKKDAVEGLKEELYSRENAPEVHPEARTPLSASDANPPTAWVDGIKILKPRVVSSSKEGSISQHPMTPEGALEYAPPPLFLQMSTKKNKRWSLPIKFFIGSVIFFILACGAATYFFLVGGNTISSQNIDLSIEVPSVVDGGKVTTLQIVMDNRNQSPLQLVDLILTYPDGTRDPNDQTQSLTSQRQSIGTVASGQQLLRTASAVFFAQEGVQQQVSATLEYTVPGSNAVFQKQATATFTVGSSPVSLSINAPSEAVAGQPFEIDITAQSNATTPVSDVVVQGQYPFGYTPTSATPAGEVGDTLWRLGTMAPGSTQTIKLMGTIDGQDGDQRIFTFFTGSDSDVTDTQIPVPFLSVPATLTVQKPFISAQIALNGQTGSSVSIPASGQVSGTITWQNNLPDSVSNAQLVLTLSGPMLDPTSVNASTGFYQSTNSTITWSGTQEPTLVNIPPGGTGTLPFNFSVVGPTQGGTLYTNPVIDLSVAVSGVRQGQDNVPEQVPVAASLEASISSATTLAATAEHFSGPFTNDGPMPPSVGTATTYTVVWTANNSSNIVGNTTVSATLPPYITFVAAQANSGITYDAPSRTVTWTIGDLTAGAGYTLPAASAAFQVSFLPSSSQVGQSPALTGTATLSGQDRFAQVPISSTAQGPTIQLTGDTGYQNTMSQVVQ
jgi:Domain of unknown function DUF11